MIFDADSVTSIAHQLGYFETIGGADTFDALPETIDAVTLDDVADAARRVLVSDNRTIGWFEPQK